jgi:Protein of unknown function (DUF1194)
MKTTRLMNVLGALLAGLASLVSAPPLVAQTQVDLELVLAVDVSYSMDLDEQRLQRDGYVDALRDPEVLKAIQSGQHGRIAITYVEWAGWGIQNVVLPWTLVDGRTSAAAVASKLAEAPISRHRRTSVTGALLFSERQFGRGGFVGERRVVDVSGDGPNNAGPPVGRMRDQLVANGIVINGLPVMVKSGGTGAMFDIVNLDDYYTTCVIGGPGSFMIPIRDKAEFATATRQKLLLEIAGLEPPPQPTKVQQRGQIDCMVGEQMWQRYYDGQSRE